MRPAVDGPLAAVVRGARIESVHRGHLVVLAPEGTVRLAVGHPGLTLWPRSSLKPVQAVAMLRAGLDADEEELALACASHSGTDAHLAVVRRMLGNAGLAERDLQNTPDLPLDADAAASWRAAGREPAPVAQNCSGKHAAMLATCVAAGWPPSGYRGLEHPLQRAVRATVSELTGEPVMDTTVDGCGAPLFSTTLVGLARALGRIARAGGLGGGSGTGGVGGGSGTGGVVAGPVLTAEARVARAMVAHPWLVGGPGRDVSRFMAAVPGLVAKDGAEGVYAAGLPDGGGVAFKVADGSGRPRAAILAAALEVALGGEGVAGAEDAVPGEVNGLGDGVAGVVQAVREVGRTPVLGHGRPVGEVHAVLGRDENDVQIGRQW